VPIHFTFGSHATVLHSQISSMFLTNGNLQQLRNKSVLSSFTSRTWIFKYNTGPTKNKNDAFKKLVYFPFVLQIVNNVSTSSNQFIYWQSCSRDWKKKKNIWVKTEKASRKQFYITFQYYTKFFKEALSFKNELNFIMVTESAWYTIRFWSLKSWVLSEKNANMGGVHTP
jgi:hypothetical protein